MSKPSKPTVRTPLVEDSQDFRDANCTSDPGECRIEPGYTPGTLVAVRYNRTTGARIGALRKFSGPDAQAESERFAAAWNRPVAP